MKVHDEHEEEEEEAIMIKYNKHPRSKGFFF